MNVRYRVELSQSERAELMQLLSGGTHAARKLKRVQVLLAADSGARDDEIARSIGVGKSTVYRTFVLSSLEAARSEEPRRGAERSSAARRKPCWWRLPARARRPAAPVGRWNCWPAEAPDPKRPVVCFDESPIQFIGEVRQPISAAPAQR